MSRKHVIYAICAVVTLSAVSASRVVWLPDVITKRHIVLCRAVNDARSQFWIEQSWNGSDGYIATFYVRNINGRDLDFIIDPDGAKIWEESLTVDEKSKTVWIRKGSRTEASFDWSSEVFTKLGGV